MLSHGPPAKPAMPTPVRLRNWPVNSRRLLLRLSMKPILHPADEPVPALRYSYAFSSIVRRSCSSHMRDSTTESCRPDRHRLLPRREVHGLQHHAAGIWSERPPRLDGGRPFLVPG